MNMLILSQYFSLRKAVTFLNFILVLSTRTLLRIDPLLILVVHSSCPADKAELHPSHDNVHGTERHPQVAVLYSLSVDLFFPWVVVLSHSSDGFLKLNYYCAL